MFFLRRIALLAAPFLWRKWRNRSRTGQQGTAPPPGSGPPASR
ncbi:hypothetical protein BH20ACT3_BH20ACT3_10670 [soil metagenome]